jgi:asparaginyl-tRNA synthetase
MPNASSRSAPTTQRYGRLIPPPARSYGIQAYPLQNKSHSPDFLRTIPHLRHRSPYGSLLLRLRSAVINAVTAYFHAHDWVQTHPPVITSSDCEGAGEVFSVTHDGGRPREHFFRAPKYLTVSAQLHLEALAQAVGKVWTLSPTFRAETSDSPRHLSEFYMLEAEMVFAADLNRVMDVVEGLLTAVGKDLLGNSQLREELALATENGDKTPTIVNVSRETLEKRWRRLAQGGYSRITHREAVALLDAAVKAGHVFDRAPAGALQAEHEKYLAQHFDGPVFVTDYPRDVKPFYMAASPGAGGTVSCFDLVVPDVCELAGGSLREHDPERLQAAMEARGLAEDELQWYMDLRRYGSVAHGGFGLGFDRLLCHLSGVNSLRDVVAFPRWHGRCDC